MKLTYDLVITRAQTRKSRAASFGRLLLTLLGMWALAFFGLSMLRLAFFGACQ